MTILANPQALHDKRTAWLDKRLQIPLIDREQACTDFDFRKKVMAIMAPPHDDSDDSNRYYSRYTYQRRTSSSPGPVPPPPYYGHRGSLSPISSLTPLGPPFHPKGTFKPRGKDSAPVPSPPPPYNPSSFSSLFRHSDGMTDLSFSTAYASSLQPHSRRRTRAQGQSATDRHTDIGPKERVDRYEHWERRLTKTQKPEDKSVKVEQEIVDAAVRLALERQKQEDILNHLAKERKRERLLRAFKTKVLEAEVKRRKDESEVKRREEVERKLREEVERRRREELEKKIRELERMRKQEMQERKIKEEAERRTREEMHKKAERERFWRARFNIDLLEEREIHTPKEKKRYGTYFYRGSDGELIEWVWGERR